MKKTMPAKRRETLRQLLHAMREREITDIEGQLGRDLDAGVTRKIDAAMDAGDWGALDLAEGVDHKILEMRYQTYKEIADAFRRLEAGTYGVCERCGAEIPFSRLRAEPFARYCAPCLSKMEAVERAEKGIGKPSTM